MPMARAKGSNRAALTGFFDIIEAEFEKHNHNPNRIFNVDETGLSVVQSKIPKAVALKGKRQVGVMTSAERGSLLSVISCMSAAGTYVPPIIIFPRKDVSNLQAKGAPLGTVFMCQPSGWINSSVFCEWFDHFTYSVKRTQEGVIIVDSRWTLRPDRKY
jgi:hypothetical protein